MSGISGVTGKIKPEQRSLHKGRFGGMGKGTHTKVSLQACSPTLLNLINGCMKHWKMPRRPYNNHSSSRSL